MAPWEGPAKSIKEHSAKEDAMPPKLPTTEEQGYLESLSCDIPAVSASFSMANVSAVLTRSS